MKNGLLIILFLIPVFLSAQKGGCAVVRFIDAGTGDSLDSVKIILRGNYITYDTISVKHTAPNVSEIVTKEKSSVPVYYDSAFSITARWKSGKLPAGVYTMTIEKSGYQTCIYHGVIISDLKTTYFDNPPVELLPVDYKKPKTEKAPEEKKSQHKKKHY
jgi:hypothetical protein